MIQTFKIMNNIDDVDPCTWFTRIDDCHQRTRQAVSVDEDGEVARKMNLLRPNSRLDVRKNFFSCRVVEPWNRLPSVVQEADDVEDFKVKYDGFIAGTVQQ